MGYPGEALTRGKWVLSLEFLPEHLFQDVVCPVCDFWLQPYCHGRCTVRPERSKRARYRIIDPYVAFWHRFISPMVSAGMIGLAPGEQLWSEFIEPKLDNYMGGVFESVCRDFVRLRPSLLPFQPLRTGEWWDASSRNEIDVIALGADNQILIGECKWGSVNTADLAQLRTRADLLLRELGGGPYKLHLALFAAGKVAPALASEIAEGRVLCFSAEDLFQHDS